MIIEYGAMSSKFSVEAENKLVAYVAIILHYDRNNHLVVIYSPIECKSDTWANFNGQVSETLDKLFFENSGKKFDEFVEDNKEDIRKAYETIKRIT